MLHMTEGAVTVVRSRMWVSLRKVLSFLRKSRLVMTGNTLSFFRIDWIFRIRAVTSCALNAFCSMTISTELVSGDVLSGKEALLAGEGISVDLSISSIEKELKSGLVVQVLPYWSRPAWHVTFAIRRESLSNSRLVKFALWLKERERTNVAIRFDKYRKMGFLR